MEGADETSININHLACSWMTKMKEEHSIKKRKRKWEKGIEMKRETL